MADAVQESEHAADSRIGAHAVRGVLWSTAQRWVVRVSGLVTVVLLTHLLGPAQFGLVAIATAFTPVVYLVSDMGFSTYLVQSPQLTKQLVSTGFWYSLSAGLVLVGLLVAAAPLIGASFHEPAAVPIVYGIAPSVFFGALASVPSALLQRKLAFKALAVRTALGGLAGQVVAVILAFAGAGTTALVMQLVVTQFVACALAWSAARWVPSFEFSPKDFRAMVRFGSNIVASDGVAMLRGWAETAIIAAALGATGLGYLNIAQRLVQVTTDLSAAAITPVSTVVFAKVRDTAERLKGSYLRALSMTYAFVMPALICVTVAAPSVVPLLFGRGWDDSIIPAQALSVAGILQVGASLDGGLFYGTGRPGRWFVYAALVDALTVAATAFGVHWGLAGTSVGFVAVALIATVARWFLVARHLQTDPLTVARPFFWASLAGAAGAAAGVAVYLVTAGLPVWPRLLLTGLALIAAHFGALRFTMPREFGDVVRVASARVGALRRSRSAV